MYQYLCYNLSVLGVHIFVELKCSNSLYKLFIFFPVVAFKHMFVVDIHFWNVGSFTCFKVDDFFFNFW